MPVSTSSPFEPSVAEVNSLTAAVESTPFSVNLTPSAKSSETPSPPRIEDATNSPPVSSARARAVADLLAMARTASFSRRFISTRPVPDSANVALPLPVVPMPTVSSLYSETPPPRTSSLASVPLLPTNSSLPGSIHPRLWVPPVTRIVFVGVTQPAEKTLLVSPLIHHLKKSVSPPASVTIEFVPQSISCALGAMIRPPSITRREDVERWSPYWLLLPLRQMPPEVEACAPGSRSSALPPMWTEPTQPA